MKLSEKLKPAVSKRTLLLIAGLAWTTAGGILFSRGLSGLIMLKNYLLLRLAIGVVLGSLFYLVLFSKISFKHIQRIRGLQITRPCAFSFFNLRSYFMMTIMITGGIMLRKFNMVDHSFLFTFYLTMGFPLLASALRFYYSWYRFNDQL
jgi:hypothetical protein